MGIEEIIFLAEAQAESMKRVAKIVLNNEAYQIKKSYHLWLHPRRNVASSEILKITQIFGKFADIKDLDFDLVPIDADLLSLERASAPRELFLDNELSVVTYIANTIARLEFIYGQIPVVFGKGDKAKAILDILNQQRETDKEGEGEEKKGKFDAMIIIDRSIDWITPCISQVTYEGLVDDTFEIRNCVARIDGKILSAEAKDKTVPLLLNQNDPIFKEIRNYTAKGFSKFLNEKAQSIQKSLAEKHNLNISGAKELVMLLKKEYHVLSYHINLKDHLMSNVLPSHSYLSNFKIEQGVFLGDKSSVTLDHIELMIAKGLPFRKVLKMLCLRSLMDNGIKKESLLFLKREILQTYGYEHLFTLVNLEKVGLLRKQEGKSPFPKLNQVFKLVNPDYDEERPDDAAYFYEGVAPLSVRLVEQMFKKGNWKATMEAIESIPGKTIYNDKLNYDYSNKAIRNCFLVYFIGGITHAEASAIRFLGKLYNKEIVIATTNVMGRYGVIQPFEEKMNVVEMQE
eukprot:TRINITY_DN599_c0_g4_i2.p1 TRINITY_DN599_c0_g4~~TRINITY_DN599_c0_g4_i2.p1  ORF type:complete len:514 (+),score=148.27 TRINITY_DN599_c0_g4_i2:30-1571(+)